MKFLKLTGVSGGPVFIIPYDVKKIEHVPSLMDVYGKPPADGTRVLMVTYGGHFHLAEVLEPAEEVARLVEKALEEGQEF